MLDLLLRALLGGLGVAAVAGPLGRICCLATYGIFRRYLGAFGVAGRRTGLFIRPSI